MNDEKYFREQYESKSTGRRRIIVQKIELLEAELARLRSELKRL